MLIIKPLSIKAREESLASVTVAVPNTWLELMLVGSLVTSTGLIDWEGLPLIEYLKSERLLLLPASINKSKSTLEDKIVYSQLPSGFTGLSSLSPCTTAN